MSTPEKKNIKNINVHELKMKFELSREKTRKTISLYL